MATALTTVISGLSLIGRDLHVSVYYDDGTCKTVTRSTKGKKPNGEPLFSIRSLNDLLTGLKQKTRMVFTIDAYLFLVLEKGLWKDEDVDLVIPWPADNPCERYPENEPWTDLICRWAARYYQVMSRKPVRQWNGQVVTYPYKACNTVSFRAYAAYQNTSRENRAKMGPADQSDTVLQFDWKAAEWRLMAAVCGYTDLPQDAYQDFVSESVSRDVVKFVVLKYVYGSHIHNLYSEYSQEAIDSTVYTLHQRFPNVMLWRDSIAHKLREKFFGFEIELSDVEGWKRPNRYIQTALQLVKLELISRLAHAADIDANQFAAGDMHDALVFHLTEQQVNEGLGQTIVREISQPAFRAIPMECDFSVGSFWR